jgi:hypothetical protein
VDKFKEYKIPEKIKSRSKVKSFIDNKNLAPLAIDAFKTLFPTTSDYAALHYLMHHEAFPLEEEMQNRIEQIEIDNQFNHTKTQAQEILQIVLRLSPHLGYRYLPTLTALVSLYHLLYLLQILQFGELPCGICWSWGLKKILCCLIEALCRCHM